jgi:hypothetical protein
MKRGGERSVRPLEIGEQQLEHLSLHLR